MFRFGVLYLCRGREARGFFKSGVSIFSTPIQRIQPDESRSYLTCSGANKGPRRCALLHGRSGSQGSTETPCRSLCPGRRIGSLPCSDGRFAGSGSGSCSPYLPAKSTYSSANALVHGRRYTLSYLETRESRTCCLHGKTGPSGRWHTAQTAPPENTQRPLANEELRQSHSLPLG